MVTNGRTERDIRELRKKADKHSESIAELKITAKNTAKSLKGINLKLDSVVGHIGDLNEKVYDNKLDYSLGLKDLNWRIVIIIVILSLLGGVGGTQVPTVLASLI